MPRVAWRVAEERRQKLNISHSTSYVCSLIHESSFGHSVQQKLRLHLGRRFLQDPGLHVVPSHRGRIDHEALGQRPERLGCLVRRLLQWTCDSNRDPGRGCFASQRRCGHMHLALGIGRKITTVRGRLHRHWLATIEEGIGSRPVNRCARSEKNNCTLLRT